MKKPSLKNFTIRASITQVRVQAPAETLRRLVPVEHRIASWSADESRILNLDPAAILALSEIAGNPAITGLGMMIQITPRPIVKTEQTIDRVEAWISSGLQHHPIIDATAEVASNPLILPEACPQGFGSAEEELMPIAINLHLDHVTCRSLGLKTLSGLIGFRFRPAMSPFFRVDHSFPIDSYLGEPMCDNAADVQANRRFGDALGKLQVAFSHEQIVVRQLVRQAMRPVLPQVCAALVTDGLRISVPHRSGLRFLPSLGTKLLLHAKREARSVCLPQVDGLGVPV